MKLLISVLIFLAATSANAASVCTDFNTQTRVAREAVKALVSLANIPNVVAYYGGADEVNGNIMIVNVLPYMAESRDWYKVAMRMSDCRVMGVTLIGENLPLKKR